jgi:hypothetical protein
VLRLPDLDHTKLSVLNTLGSPQSQRAYGIAIDDFIGWYCSEPRIAFDKTVVLRYRIQLEAKHLAPATINLRLAAVRRLAYEAADVGLLSPDLAAGIRRVKGAKRLGVRLGNWLSAEQAKDLLLCQMEKRWSANVTVQFSACCSGAGCGALKPLSLPWSISSAGTITGPSSICSAKAAIFDRCPFRTG